MLRTSTIFNIQGEGLYLSKLPEDELEISEYSYIHTSPEACLE